MLWNKNSDVHKRQKAAWGQVVQVHESIPNLRESTWEQQNFQQFPEKRFEGVPSAGVTHL